eukprot:Plantae.Rhodophyta-Purpureofilum_apyrenoidigerum.ctg12561.p3 GENE.Plantae.Rhodophyta-Purpureofilum_apyrenoidigerum.ctg12561~~Plantae.Rhodophyta-Purpureofilum_apyrenoidigerum.ctg12561.p3  ORF type:complete len:164 (-),score=31.92 Plantae.Rhodophyta-Purpureofilum_apyrenoidigerum.ctg12561:143-634(-)
MSAFVPALGVGNTRRTGIEVDRLRILQATPRKTATLQMAGRSDDKCVTLAPYFKIHDGKVEEFKKRVDKFYELIKTEDKLMHYSFCFTDDGRALCREGYNDAEGLKIHLDNVGETFKDALTVADLERMELHAPASEMEKLKDHPVIIACKTILYTLDGQGVRQ